jgi:hypothetical protein
MVCLDWEACANVCDAQISATACIFGAYGKERNKNMWPSMNWRRMGEGSYWDRRIYSPGVCVPREARDFFPCGD